MRRRLAGGDMIQVVQNLASVSINTDDIAVFTQFKEIFHKNFGKILGKKSKILAFFMENETQKRKNFLKNLQKFADDEALQSAYYKTFKLNFEHENALKPIILVDVEFENSAIILKLNANESLFVRYLRGFFKGHDCAYHENSQIFIIPYKDEGTVALFKDFASDNEHFKYCVDFDIDEAEFDAFATKMHKKQSNRWKFDALAKLFGSYFQALGCTPEHDLSQIRQKYLILVKAYHPDFHHDKPVAELAHYRERFEQIQIAYDNLKSLYKHNG